MSGREAWDAVTRRGALKRIVLAAAGLPLVELAGRWSPAMAAPAEEPGGAPSTPQSGRARSVIEIWMSGGPSHIDTFDPKPEAGRDWCGPFDGTVDTVADGMRLGQLFPLLAKQANRFSLVRSMSHGVNGHETATYIVQTGRTPGERIVFPCIGAVTSLFRGYGRGYESLVPPYVVLTASQGRFSEAGFLGPRYRPFVTGGDPNRERFVVEGIVAEGITDERQGNRKDLLGSLDSLGNALPGDPRFDRFDAAGAKAWDMILGDAGKLFDLNTEKKEMRDLYGRNTFGQSCLMARRLVEHGVPYITINTRGWDTHKQHFEIMRRRLPEIDRGIAALLQDLASHGLLDTTVVWCCGEFGRGPRVQWDPPWNGGRSHHGAVFSALVAGGGFRGGIVVGESDAHAEKPKRDPVHPRELHRAIYSQLGIDPDGPLPNGLGLDLKVAEPATAEKGKAPLDAIL